MPLTNAAIRRLSRKAGVNGVGAARVNDAYTSILTKVVRRALKYARNSNGREIKLHDVDVSLALLGQPLFDKSVYNSELAANFPRATFETDAENAAGGVHFSDKAINRLICFMDKYLVKYVQTTPEPPTPEPLTPPTQTPPAPEPLTAPSLEPLTQNWRQSSQPSLPHLPEADLVTQPTRLELYPVTTTRG